jgi:hypothetical protein
MVDFHACRSFPYISHLSTHAEETKYGCGILKKQKKEG